MLRQNFRFLLILLSLGAAFCFYSDVVAKSDKIIAVVNDDVITQSELDAKVAAMQQHAAGASIGSDAKLHKKVLNDLIDRSLELQIAARNNLQVSDKEVTEAIASIAARNKLTLSQLQQELLKQGLKYQDFRKQIHDDMVIGRISRQAVSGKINVSEQEINAYLRKANAANAAMLAAAKEYHLLDILIPATAKPGEKGYEDGKKIAVSILDKLRKGGTVEDIVEHTSFAGKPLVGSDLGWRDVASLPDQFKAIIPQLKPRDAAGPIIAPNGLHIIVLINIRQAVNQQAAKQQISRDEAREMVYRNKVEDALKPWLQQLRATAYIKIME